MHSILSQTLISNLQQIKVYLNLYSNCDSVDFWIWVITALLDCVEQQGCKMSEYYHIITAQKMIERYKVDLIEGNPKSIYRFELKYNTISHLLISSKASSFIWSWNALGLHFKLVILLEQCILMVQGCLWFLSNSLIITDKMWLIMQQRHNASSNSCNLDVVFLCQLILPSLEVFTHTLCEYLIHEVNALWNMRHVPQVQAC